MPRTLIIGYGNPLRGDDALGFRAAERLDELIDDPDVEVVAVHQLNPELMDNIRRADRVIFIDAAAEGEPGAIHRRDLAPTANESSFTHQATPGALLLGARILYGRAPQATLFSVPGESFELSETLSPCIDDALNRLVAEILSQAGQASRPVTGQPGSAQPSR